jgi:hypothetical protein
VIGVATTIACGKSDTPASPSGVTAAGTAAGANGETLKVGAPTLVSPANGFQAPAGSSAPIVLTFNNVNGTYASFPVTYELEIRNSANALISNPKVAAASGSTTSVTNTATLAADTSYTWRVRATYNGGLGPWSTTWTFRTAVQAFINSSTSSVFDPLTIGFSVGNVRGGSFSSAGWTAKTTSDGIDYDLAQCPSCKVEFDITGVGNGLGNPADLKFISMGDGSAWFDFTTFRDAGYKMTVEQRGDGDGTGMKLIWRIGNDADDHTTKFDSGPAWADNKVFHFIVQWTPSSYNVSIDGTTWFSGSLQGPYTPPNFKVGLGCSPRSESLLATWRNVKISPN